MSEVPAIDIEDSPWMAEFKELVGNMLACNTNQQNNYIRAYNKSVKGAMQNKLERLHHSDPYRISHHSETQPHSNSVTKGNSVLTDSPSYRFNPPHNVDRDLQYHWFCYDVNTFLHVSAPGDGYDPEDWGYLDDWGDEA